MSVTLQTGRKVLMRSGAFSLWPSWLLALAMQKCPRMHNRALDCLLHHRPRRCIIGSMNPSQDASAERTTFRVFYALRADPAARLTIGQATLVGKRVSFTASSIGRELLEEQGHEWLSTVRKEVARLCRACGHNGHYAIIWSEASCLGVKRQLPLSVGKVRSAPLRVACVAKKKKTK